MNLTATAEIDPTVTAAVDSLPTTSVLDTLARQVGTAYKTKYPNTYPLWLNVVIRWDRFSAQVLTPLGVRSTVVVVPPDPPPVPPPADSGITLAPYELSSGEHLDIPTGRSLLLMMNLTMHAGSSITVDGALIGM